MSVVFGTNTRSQSTIEMDKGYYGLDSLIGEKTLIPSQSTIEMDKGYYLNLASIASLTCPSRNPQ